MSEPAERLLDRAAHDPVQMPFDPLVIDPDNIVERLESASSVDLAIIRRP